MRAVVFNTNIAHGEYHSIAPQPIYLPLSTFLYICITHIYPNTNHFFFAKNEQPSQSYINEVNCQCHLRHTQSERGICGQNRCLDKSPSWPRSAKAFLGDHRNLFIDFETRHWHSCSSVSPWKLREDCFTVLTKYVGKLPIRVKGIRGRTSRRSKWTRTKPSRQSVTSFAALWRITEGHLTDAPAPSKRNTPILTTSFIDSVAYQPAITKDALCSDWGHRKTLVRLFWLDFYPVQMKFETAFDCFSIAWDFIWSIFPVSHRR